MHTRKTALNAGISLANVDHLESIELACSIASNRGQTQKDNEYLALIEGLLRDALGQDHGVWNWRVPPHLRGMRVVAKELAND